MNVQKGKTLIRRISDNKAGCLQKPNANCLSQWLPSQPRPGLSSAHSTLASFRFLAAAPAAARPSPPIHCRGGSFSPFKALFREILPDPPLRRPPMDSPVFPISALSPAGSILVYLFTWLFHVSASQLQTP